MRKTDWNAYYGQGYKAARFSRRVTAALLRRLIGRFAPGTGPDLNVLELGGANSCFYQDLVAAFHPGVYDVADNNEMGLEAFRQRALPGVRSTAHNLDVLSPDIENLAGRYDLCFSVGLIEHFDPPGTARAVAAHFTALRPGGVALITFPTPTWLYRATRFLAEKTGQWIFWDERPLLESEVRAAVRPHGEILHTGINWWIFLTQGFLVARKPSGPG